MTEGLRRGLTNYGDAGFSRSYTGTRDDYRAKYRAGFRQGYEAGYRSGTRADPR